VGTGTGMASMKGKNKGLYKDAPGGIVIAVAALLLVIAVLVGLFGNRFMKTAEKATAEIINIQANGDSHVVTVRYTDKGGVSRQAQLNSYNASMRIGQFLEIYYQPDNPSSVRTGGSSWIVILIVGGMGVVFFLVGYSMMRKQREEKWLCEHGTRYDAVPVDCRLSTNVTRISSSGSSTIQSTNVSYTYVLICHYRGQDGTVYECSSRALNYDPRPYLSRNLVSIYVNSENPKKYFMDVLGSMDSNVVRV